MRRAYHELSIISLPTRVYREFAIKQFKETRIRLHISGDGSICRIDRFPKNIRELVKKRRLLLKADESIRFAINPQQETEETPLLQNDHPLYKMALELGGSETQQVAIPVCRIKANVPEPITIELDQISVVDGTGRELEQSLIILGKRKSGEWVQIDPYFLFNNDFEVIDSNSGEDSSFKKEAIMQARRLLQEVQMRRDDYINKKSIYLRRSFDEKMTILQNRLLQYEQNNNDNKNSALINQIYTQIEDLEERSRERLEDIERERSIHLQPIKRIAQLIIEPSKENTGRLIPNDVFQIVKEYEYRNGRLNIQKRKAFGLVDFTSEGPNHETRFIIVTDSLSKLLRTLRYYDYLDIENFVYIYVLENDQVREEIQLKKNELFSTIN
ncbi:hypothetical protein [Bacillus smithii]|uniref:hypothetical protein n=1 Tax=Bacillus smithii TaxID=1479 RepID=UPI003D1F3B39